MLVLATVVFLLIVIPNNTCAGLQLGRALKHKETNYRVEEGDMLFPIKTAGWTPDDAGDPTFPHSGVVRKYSWPEGIIPYVLLEDDIGNVQFKIQFVELYRKVVLVQAAEGCNHNFISQFCIKHFRLLSCKLYSLPYIVCIFI